MGDDTVRYRVTVTGRVQGVWYRDSCRAEADAEHVAGWISNTGDGSVEAVLEGDRAAVDRVVAWMRAGPPRARVVTLDMREEPPRGERGFAVR